MPEVLSAKPKFAKKQKIKSKLTQGDKLLVKTMINKSMNKRMEKKYHMEQDDSATPSYAGTVVDITEPAQGDGDITRDGDEIYLRSINVKGFVRLADSTNQVRIILFQWRGDTATDPPAVTQVLSSSQVSTALAPVAKYYHDGRALYRIIYDKVFNLDAGNPQQLFNTGYLRLPFRKARFNAAATTGTDHVHMLLISDSAAATHPTVGYVSTLTFNDC